MKKSIIVILPIFAIFIFNSMLFAEDKVLLKDGSPVILRLTEEVSTKTKNQNDIVHLEVTRNVMVDDKIVIKGGTPAEGTVTVCEKPDIIGQEGTIAFMVNSTTTVDGQWISLRANLSRSGQSKEILSAGAAWACCPIFGLIKGTHASYPEGTEVKAYTENDVKIMVQ